MPTNQEMLERIVALETRDMRTATDLQEIKDLNETLNKKVDDLLARERMQRGFIAGVVFIVSGLWGLFTISKDAIVRWLKT